MNIYESYLEHIKQSRLETATGVYLDRIAAYMGIGREDKQGNLKSDCTLREECESELNANKSLQP